MIKKTGAPYWKRDYERKAYFVYDQNGVEVKKIPYEKDWDASAQYKEAIATVGALNVQLAKVQEEADENKPLTKFEKEFLANDIKLKELFEDSKISGDLDGKIYKKYNKLCTRMSDLSEAGLIRDSILVNASQFNYLLD